MIDSKHPEKLRELIRRDLYRIKVQTESMIQGTVDHMILEQGRNVISDPRTIFSKILSRQTFYFSLGFCSVRYGLRGTVDAILCEPIWERLLRLTIIDDKTHAAPHYWKQVWAYGMILSDPNCMYTTSFNSESEETSRQLFYPAIGIGSIYNQVEILTTLNPYKGRKGEILDRPIPPKMFSRGGIYENKGLVFAVLKSKRKILDAREEPAMLAVTGQMRFHGSLPLTEDHMERLLEPKRPH